MTQVFQATIQDESGTAISGATVTVKIGTALGATATIYSDSSGTALANPFTSAADGLAQFWADAGTYYIEATDGVDTSDGWTVAIAPDPGRMTVTLSATVAIGEAVTADGALVDTATIDEVLGIAAKAGGSGDVVSVVKDGNITVGSWSWTPDQFVYLTAAGALTQIVPATTHRRIGIATTATTLAVNIDPTVREAGGTGSENAIPALNDNGLIAYTMIAKAATGGAGAESKLVQADESGLIDTTFLTVVIDTSKNFTASGSITAGGAVSLIGNMTVAATGVGNVANFIGFAEATVADTETVKVTPYSDVNTDQTGLTFGETYYVLDDGTLSTTDDDGNGAVGYALSATDILVTRNTW